MSIKVFLMPHAVQNMGILLVKYKNQLMIYWPSLAISSILVTHNNTDKPKSGQLFDIFLQNNKKQRQNIVASKSKSYQIKNKKLLTT